MNFNKKTLLVISHTEHYYDRNGVLVGWGATVSELNYLAKNFERVIHLGCLYKCDAPSSALPYTEDNILFVPIPPVGGGGIWNKVKILLYAPLILLTLIQCLRKCDFFQFRAPTSIGLYIIPFLTFFSKKHGWFKYAGNWAHESPPLSYRIQRWWLAHVQKRYVTINGSWPNQPKHCITFENPCLHLFERQIGLDTMAKKSYKGELIGCFVGRLERAKGVGYLLNALKLCQGKISELHLVGDSPEREMYERIALEVNTKVYFHGFLPRNDVFEIYKKAHLFFLPSEGEGFPKVVAEAANFGCVPIVSNVSSIPQYIKEENGYVWNMGDEKFEDYFCKIDVSKDSLTNKAENVYSVADLFTFERYEKNIRKLLMKEF
jgi:glycosyltransferase involved in cell wall biosynthesis